MTKAYMILDLQFGSTGKGLLAGYLAKMRSPDVVVTAWGPNAGHTYIDSDGRHFIHRMLANGIVSPNLKAVLIGPGSVIDLDALEQEVDSSLDLMAGRNLVIHPKAVIVTAKHRETETRNVKIGSTMKGTGAAVIERIERDPDNNPTAGVTIPADWMQRMLNKGVNVFISESMYRLRLTTAEMVQIEGAQGYSLSIYHGLYPYTTSRDVTPAQVMADCAIPFSMIPEVYGTLRTYPIRVADRFDADGKKIGTSGPCYPDQKELDWSDIGIEPELTTVTKLPRRIFGFSHQQVEEAIFQCGVTKLFLNFTNYMWNDKVIDLIAEIESKGMAKIEWVGTGPAHDNVMSKIHWLSMVSGEQK